jgi:hypothetical protein
MVRRVNKDVLVHHEPPYTKDEVDEFCSTAAGRSRSSLYKRWRVGRSNADRI